FALDWLDDEIHGARLDRLDDNISLALSAHHCHPRAWIESTDHLQSLQSIHFGHDHVHEYRIRLHLLVECDCLSPVLCQDNLMPEIAQHFSRPKPYECSVVHH